MRAPLWLALLLAACSHGGGARDTPPPPGSTVTGVVMAGSPSTGVADARVTLFVSDLTSFWEVRTAPDGTFSITDVPVGDYRFGVAALGLDYEETALPFDGADPAPVVQLVPEDHAGEWRLVGNTAPELLNGTGSGSLLPSGEVFYCHDTVEPILFDPATGGKSFPVSSSAAQGCHSITLMTNGDLLFIGGAMNQGNPVDPVVDLVKAFRRGTNDWEGRTSMNVARWYPGVVRLADERLLVIGGEQDGAPGRTDTCEIYDPALDTWTMTASIERPTEIPPAVLLYTGEVLKTWRESEVYNPSLGTWRPVGDMLQPRIGATGGDHSDHSIVHLEDGRVMAIGIQPVTLTASTESVELFDPGTESWTAGPSPRHVRARPESLMMADGRVLAFGGEYFGLDPSVELGSAGLVENLTKLADIYDPSSNSWRPVADMNRFIHYHNVSVLALDGRVIASAGAGAGGSLFGVDDSIEAYAPPYLFRGVRPQIDTVSKTDLRVGDSLDIEVSYTSSPSRVVLLGFRAVTHWIDGGPQRYVSLPFTTTVSGTTTSIAAILAGDSARLPPGHYMLVVLVDDIPSEGVAVRVLP